MGNACSPTNPNQGGHAQGYATRRLQCGAISALLHEVYGCCCGAKTAALRLRVARVSREARFGTCNMTFCRRLGSLTCTTGFFVPSRANLATNNNTSGTHQHASLPRKHRRPAVRLPRAMELSQTVACTPAARLHTFVLDTGAFFIAVHKSSRTTRHSLRSCACGPHRVCTTQRSTIGCIHTAAVLSMPRSPYAARATQVAQRCWQ